MDLLPIGPHFWRIQLIDIILPIHELMHNEFPSDRGKVIMEVLDPDIQLSLLVFAPRLQLLGKQLQHD